MEISSTCIYMKFFPPQLLTGTNRAANGTPLFQGDSEGKTLPTHKLSG